MVAIEATRTRYMTYMPSKEEALKGGYETMH